ncbi:MAG: aminopeptidase [Sphaerochaetaceae bacterium]|nr:aminopeptidase [Sphaerochaetaceae bacterium]
MDRIIDGYMKFLDNCKTERRAAAEIIKRANAAGYRNINDVNSLKAGDKVYYEKMGKSVILFEIGSDCISKGMNILGAHIDSPRLDIKQSPVYERDGLVYLNTHYYGGIKKYQWLTIPLTLCGCVFLTDGRCVDINIGDGEDDPVFYISDILPHAAQEQMKKTASEIVEGEKLDIIAGSRSGSSVKDEKKDIAKKNILALLKKNYGIEEEDFASAELEVVPSGKTRFVGFDKSLILGYGQDDRVCAYTSLEAMLASKAGERTNCCILVDKEEIGSYGATGMNSHILDNALAEVISLLQSADCGCKEKERRLSPELVLRRSLANSYMLSSDVNSAYDPLNPELYDRQNSSFLGGGVVFNKYTGARGKSGASDANPEFIAKIRGRLTEDKVTFQYGELSKVDGGGGGTIAHYAAEFGLSVIDCGVPVHSMHAPWELTSVFDVKQAFAGYCSFLKLK